MSQPFIGEIRLFGFDFPPKFWALCQGQLLAIQQNQALFSILGTTYGGNGVQTFALPDLRGRSPIHWGTGPGLPSVTLGEVAGTETQSLLTSQIPAHNHLAVATTGSPDAPNPSGNYWAGGNQIYAAAADSAMSPGALANAGGSQPHDNMQPSLAMNFSIALQGIFPSRN